MFIDQTDPGRVHAVLYVSRGGRKVERNRDCSEKRGNGAQRLLEKRRGRRRKLEAEVGTGGRSEKTKTPGPWEVRGTLYVRTRD